MCFIPYFEKFPMKTYLLKNSHILESHMFRSMLLLKIVIVEKGSLTCNQIDKTVFLHIDMIHSFCSMYTYVTIEVLKATNYLISMYISFLPYDYSVKLIQPI